MFNIYLNKRDYIPLNILPFHITLMEDKINMADARRVSLKQRKMSTTVTIFYEYNGFASEPTTGVMV